MSSNCSDKTGYYEHLHGGLRHGPSGFAEFRTSCKENCSDGQTAKYNGVYSTISYENIIHETGMLTRPRVSRPRPRPRPRPEIKAKVEFNSYGL